MVAIPKTVEKRIRDGIKKYKNVLKTAKNKDINEADTVTIIIEMLVDICDYDRFLDITKECAVKGSFCDIVIKLDNKILFLSEVKAIGIALKDHHFKQVVHYDSESGIDWVIFTNGDYWQAHKVIFGRPIKTELAFDFSFLETDKISELIAFFFLIGKEGAKKSPPAINIYHEERQITCRYMIAQIVQAEPFIDLIRKKLKSLSKKVTITNADISNTLKTEVLKREVMEGEEAENARKILGLNKFVHTIKTDKGGISALMQGKDSLRYQFWNQLLDLAQKKTDLHSKIKPTNPLYSRRI
jgi:predicted type IV restriction endonuclease